MSRAGLPAVRSCTLPMFCTIKSVWIHPSMSELKCLSHNISASITCLCSNLSVETIKTSTNHKDIFKSDFPMILMAPESIRVDAHGIDLSIFHVDVRMENPQRITVSAMWYKSHVHMVDIFRVEIDLWCGLLNPQHVNFYCGFCAALLRIYPIDLNGVVKICGKSTANPVSADFGAGYLKIYLKIHTWELAVGHIRQEYS